MAAENRGSDEENEIENECLKYINESFLLLEQARAAALSSSTTATNSASNSTTLSPTNAPTDSSSSSSISSSSSPSVLASASWRDQAARDFRQSFPGLTNRTSGKNVQTYLRPSLTPAPRRHSFSPYPTTTVSRRSTSTAVTSARSNNIHDNGGSLGYSTAASRKPWSGKVLNTWTHEFVCLSNPNASITVGPSILEKLSQAGLGRKKVVFKNKFGQHSHVKQTLEEVFPRFVVYMGVQFNCSQGQ